MPVKISPTLVKKLRVFLPLWGVMVILIGTTLIYGLMMKGCLLVLSGITTLRFVYRVN